MFVFWGLLSLKFTSGPVCLEEFGNLLLCQATYLGKWWQPVLVGLTGDREEDAMCLQLSPGFKKASKMKEKDAFKKRQVEETIFENSKIELKFTWD